MSVCPTGFRCRSFAQANPTLSSDRNGTVRIWWNLWNGLQRNVSGSASFLLAIVAGTAFNESRQRLDLKSKVPCTLALAVVTRT